MAYGTCICDMVLLLTTDHYWFIIEQDDDTQCKKWPAENVKHEMTMYRNA